MGAYYSMQMINCQLEQMSQTLKNLAEVDSWLSDSTRAKIKSLSIELNSITYSIEEDFNYTYPTIDIYANYRELTAIYGNNYTCGKFADYADTILEAMQNAENSLRWIENKAFVLFDTLPNYIYIHNLYTMPEYRGKGYAIALVEAVLMLAKQKQVKYVPVLVHKNNSKAISLFGKLGFTNLGGYKYGPDENVMEFKKEI